MPVISSGWGIGVAVGIDVGVSVGVGVRVGEAVKAGATVGAGGDAVTVVPQALRASVKLKRIGQ
jgi:hypothetical protein